MTQDFLEAKKNIIEALKADSFELNLVESDSGKNIRSLFQEHAIKIVESISDINKRDKENSTGDDSEESSPNTN